MFAYSVKMKKKRVDWSRDLEWLYSNLGDRGVNWTVKNNCYYFKEAKYLTWFLLR